MRYIWKTMSLTIMESKVCGQKLDCTTEHFLNAPSVTFFGIANYDIYRLWENIQQTYRQEDIQTYRPTDIYFNILTNTFSCFDKSICIFWKIYFSFKKVWLMFAQRNLTPLEYFHILTNIFPCPDIIYFDKFIFSFSQILFLFEDKVPLLRVFSQRSPSHRNSSALLLNGFLLSTLQCIGTILW